MSSLIMKDDIETFSRLLFVVGVEDTADSIGGVTF